MHLIDLLLLAFALSIDACVVSFSYGITLKRNILKSSLLLALFTGFFQGMMPVLGCICTNCVRYYIQPFSKWIIFLIFLYLGINFIKDAFEKKHTKLKLNLNILFLIALATSIDAFSAGIPLALKCTSICLPVILIGVITFIDSLLGFYCGRCFKKFRPQYLSVLGGIILIALAVKVIL